MKKYSILMLSLVFILHLTACNSKDPLSSATETYSLTSTTETNPLLAETGNGIKQISSAELLKITADMSYQEIMDLLGETAYDDSPCGWFLYKVDDMQYLQLFSDINNASNRSGAEILETIQKQNTEIQPKFISPNEAAGILESIVTVDFSWRIMFADSNYVYAKYSYGELCFRYNIKENRIDKALDCRGLINSHISGLTEVAERFTLDGPYATMLSATSGEEKESLGYRNPFPSEYMYTADFDNENVTLLSKGFDESKFPPQEECYQGEEELDGAKIQYHEAIKLSPSLPKAESGSCAVAQIDDDRFCLITQKEETSSAGYTFMIVDVKQNKVIQECALFNG